MEKATQVGVENLEVKYGDKHVVHSLNLDVPEGELCVLLGPSGCGKTTTMRSIAGLETPASGRIQIAGRDVFNGSPAINTPPFRRNVGMVFQSYAIWPHRTVAENVAFPLQMKKAPRAEIEKSVNETLDIVGLSGRGGDSASRLSGGQMQRVALARALVTHPDVLLMDEPLSNLDAKLRDKLRFEIKALQLRLGLTAVYVTHDQGEAFALADQIIVMRDGRIVQRGAPQDIYKQPANKFVADFLGMSNIFDVDIESQERSSTRVRVSKDLAFTVPSAPSKAGALSIAVPAEAVRFASTTDSDNTFDAKVLVQSFLGTTWRYRVETNDGHQLDLATSDASERHEPGTRVALRVQPDAIKLLATD